MIENEDFYFLKNTESKLKFQQQTGSIPAVSKKQVEDIKKKHGVPFYVTFLASAVCVLARVVTS